MAHDRDSAAPAQRPEPVARAAPHEVAARTAQQLPEPAISIRGVVKRFGSIVAVDRLDLEVPAGVCFGLLGPNGAGKSTTMRMLTAQALSDAGEISVLGYELPRESKQARMEMGVVPQLDNLDVELTCRQILTVFARLYRVPGAERSGAVDAALELANLMGRADTIVRELSGGMRRRLLVARGLIHRPRLVLLDEPTVGLDPQVRQELWSLIDSLRSAGVTVLMSTHYIEEAERLADVVAVMSHGRIVAQGSPAELVRAHAGEQVLEVYGPPDQLAQASELVARHGWRSRRSGPALAIMRAEALDGDAPAGVRRPANLEDAFVALTGEEIE
jgi:lipooligosaccharide transport system ATP-binding protein